MTNKRNNRPRVDKGQVLLAEPFMQDSNFKRAAIFLCERHSEGSIGFILNKPLNMRVDELIADFPSFESEVLFGGPVGTDTIHFIHHLGELLEESVLISPGVWWGGNFDKLKFLIRSELVQPWQIRFFVGYSGWGAGQLEEELEEGTWVIADMDPNYLFKDDPETLWKTIMEHKGSSYTAIADIPESPNWN